MHDSGWSIVNGAQKRGPSRCATSNAAKGFWVATPKSPWRIKSKQCWKQTSCEEIRQHFLPWALAHRCMLLPLRAARARERELLTPGANYGGPLATPQFELPGGLEGKPPTQSGCFAPGHVTQAHDSAASLRPAGCQRGKLNLRRGGGRTRGT